MEKFYLLCKKLICIDAEYFPGDNPLWSQFETESGAADVTIKCKIREPLPEIPVRSKEKSGEFLVSVDGGTVYRELPMGTQPGALTRYTPADTSFSETFFTQKSFPVMMDSRYMWSSVSLAQLLLKQNAFFFIRRLSISAAKPCFSPHRAARAKAPRRRCGKSTVQPRLSTATRRAFLLKTAFMPAGLRFAEQAESAKTKAGAWEYDIIGPWYKCNMTDITAAIGLKQLERYPSLLERRKEIIQKYDEMCDSLGIIHLDHYGENHSSSGHLYITRIPGINEEARNEIITEMAERGIACNVHYKPLPMMTAYKNLGWNIADFPNAFNFFKNEITLPLHTKLSDDDVKTVCENFADVVKKYI